MRRGDNAPMARISFVDDLTAAPVAKPAKPAKAEVKKAPAKPAVKKPAAKKAEENK